MSDSEKGILSLPLSPSAWSNLTTRQLLSPQNIRRLTLFFTLTSLLFGLLVLSDIYTLYAHPPKTLNYDPLHPSTSQTHSYESGSATSPHAIAVLLTTYTATGANQSDPITDIYFRSIRLLNYQLRHAKSTRLSNPSIPFLILSTPGVHSSKLAILKREGARIIPIPLLEAPEWARNTQMPNWAETYSRLEAFNLVQHERILVLDADTFVLRPLDAVFGSEGAREQSTRLLTADLHPIPQMQNLPDKYVMGGVQDRGMVASYFNGGFVVIKPCKEMYAYLKSVLGITQSFQPGFQEQALLNAVHRADGAMPWGKLEPRWSVICAWGKELRHRDGAASVHGRFWEQTTRQKAEDTCAVDPLIAERWRETYREMEEFYAEDQVLV